jgi:plasmid maintenance system killer protein
LEFEIVDLNAMLDMARLTGQWAMKINGPWRLVFTFRDGDAYDVEVVDYH